jgi:hypothetical protein
VTEQEELELDMRVNQRLADYAIDTFKHSQNVLFDQHSAAYKWLLASLLAINGAGLLALFDASTMPPEFRIAACALFYVGVISALLMAYLNQFSMLAATAPLSEATAHWIYVSETGETDAAGWAAIEAKLQTHKKKSDKIQIIGWISVIAFSLALTVIGYSFTQRVPQTVVEVKQAAQGPTNID